MEATSAPTPAQGENLRKTALGVSDIVFFIVAVPLHRSRHRDRGFNQADLLAASLAAGRATPYARRALTRVIDTTSQSTLSLDDRIANVLCAFAPCVDAPMLEDRRVLIVDDVVTTGATLGACAEAISRCRPRSIVGAAVALTL